MSKSGFCPAHVYYQSLSCIVISKSGYGQAMYVITGHHVLSVLFRLCSVRVYFQSTSCLVRAKPGYVQSLSIIRVHNVLACASHVMFSPSLLSESIMYFHV